MKKTLLLIFYAVMNYIAVNAQLTQNFDGGAFPPAGWTNVHTVGGNTSALWSGAGAGAFLGDDINQEPVLIDPHSGTGMASFTSYDYAAGNGAHLISGAINLSAGGPHLVKFWMYRDNIYTNQDSISVYINTSASTTGASFLGKILRKKSLAPVETGADGWYQYSFSIPGSYNTATNYIIFSAVSSYGNNMFIDDVVVESQPSCGAPSGITATGFNYGAGTATASWTASLSGSATGYEWAVNTTGTQPAGAGTGVAGTTANITGITANVVNYIYVRTVCGAGTYSTWVSFAFAALPCATLTAPLNAATNVPQDIAFTWSAVTGATSYNFYLGNTAGSEIYLGNLAGLSTPVGNLLPGQTYYWYIVPQINTIAALNTTCTSSSFTIALESGSPANNLCTGATVLDVSNPSGSTINSTTVGATLTYPANSCGGNAGAADDDVWFEFTTGATAPAGSITFTPLVTGGITDIVVEVFAAINCNSLGALVTCSDATDAANAEVVNMALLAANTHYFMRAYSYSNTTGSRGGFTVTATAGGALPVTLAGFSVRNSNGVNILSWSTQQESNSRHFVIERSNDGRKFSDIGKVAAAGNSNSKRNYFFTDNHPLKGINYYRLRSVDNDNLFKLSSVRSIRNEGLADITIYPNPVRERLLININSDKPAKGQMVISDVSGKILYTGIIKVGQGTTALPVAVDGFAPGTYILKVMLNDEQVVKKFNKM